MLQDYGLRRLPADQSGDLLATQTEYDPSRASLLAVETNLDTFFSLAIEHSQVRVDLFLWVI